LNQSIFGGSYESDHLQNAYYALTMKSGQKYLFLALEYETRPSVIAWADKVIKQHADHRVFITVHKYMSEEGRLLSKDGLPDPDHLGYNRKPYDEGGVRERLMRPNPNAEFVVCGHCYALKKGTEGKTKPRFKGVLVLEPDVATGHRSDTKVSGLTFHQLVFNAQWIPNGGDGWMLLMEFKPDNKSVEVKTFSPHLGLWRSGPEFNYTFKLAKNEAAGADE